jgi:hypothetical protein
MDKLLDSKSLLLRIVTSFKTLIHRGPTSFNILGAKAYIQHQFYATRFHLRASRRKHGKTTAEEHIVQQLTFDINNFPTSHLTSKRMFKHKQT